MDTESNLIKPSVSGPKKRIFFVITQSEMGGAQKFLTCLLPRLNKEKYEIKVGVGSDGGGELLGFLEENNIPFLVFQTLKRNASLLNDLRTPLKIRKEIKNFKPDVLFLNSSKAGMLGAIASRFPTRLPVKVIYRIGGWPFNDPRPNWQNKIYYLLEKISSRWKDIIIVNSQHDLNQAEKFNIRPRPVQNEVSTGPREKLALVYNGVDVYKTDFLDREEARLRLFERASKKLSKIFQVKFLIGTVANFYPTKGLEYLIEAAQYLKAREDIVFLIIGDGGEKSKIEKLITEKGLEKKVILIGKMKSAHQYLPGLDIFVLPSLKEGCPWSLLEAMAAKLPVIATGVGAVPEIIEQGRNGFIVEPKNGRAIADRVKEITADDHLAQELGIQAHQTILFKFSLEKMVSQIETLL